MNRALINHRGRPPAPLFGPLLGDFRDRRGLSQLRLSAMVGCDHTFISRLESGDRFPSYETVQALCRALDLDQLNRDKLMVAAGYMPGPVISLYPGEPVLMGAAQLLGDRTIPVVIRDDVREMIELLIRQALRRARELNVPTQAAD